jgi:uncharacterized membrane protein YadS
MSKEDIEAWNKSCVRDAKLFFNRLYIMGKEEDIKKVRVAIMADIEAEYQQFLMSAKEKNLILAMFNTVLNMIKHFNIDIDMLSEMMLKNSILLLGIAYMFTAFIPFGGEFIEMIIRYIVCILGGAYMYLYLKE